MQYPLEEAMNDMAVIRTTFETMNLFAAEDPIRAEMFALVFDARENLIRRFRSVCRGLEANQTEYRLDFEQFKTNALRLMTKGYPCRGLNRMLKTNAFDESETLYYYEVDGNEEAEALRQMPAHSFTVWVFNDLLQSIEDKGIEDKGIEGKANYADERVFRRRVFQKYLAVLFLCYADTDPMFFDVNQM